MYGAYDEVATGEIRLVHADSHNACFQKGASDLFQVRAKCSLNQFHACAGTFARVLHLRIQ
jgi:hypothetical protein